MKLTRSQWEHRYNNGVLKLALVGMSNIGKSYSAARLAKHHAFTLVEVDRLIWERLGERDMEAFAAWLGQPDTEGYAERERQSLHLETEATRSALDGVARNPLLDTTGSVIYTAPEVLKRLRDEWYVVYIEAVPDHVWKLQELYFQNPKPLAWNGHYVPTRGLSREENLAACYPKLLASRAAAYAAMADRTITSTDILTRDHDRLLDLVKPAR